MSVWPCRGALHRRRDAARPDLDRVCLGRSSFPILAQDNPDRSFRLRRRVSKQLVLRPRRRPGRGPQAPPYRRDTGSNEDGQPGNLSGALHVVARFQALGESGSVAIAQTILIRT
jgi:hypothetical protein